MQHPTVADAAASVRAGRRRWTARPAAPPVVAALLLLLLLPPELLGGCSKQARQGEVPVAVLGSDPEAEKKFRPLVREWVLSSPEERQRLEGRLKALCDEIKDDDLQRFALVLRAWNALERQDLEAAERLATEAMLGPAGTPRDLATVIYGAIDRRAGRFDKALERLRPLLHKLLDPYATALLDQELVAAALGAGRWAEAVDYMEAWLRETKKGDRPAVEKMLAEQLAKVPGNQLNAALKGRNTAASATRDELAMARLIAAALAQRTLTDGDVATARELLERYGPLLGTHGEAVARLAADTTRARVEAHTVGLLLSLSTVERRRRSSEVVVGMAFGLELPGGKARLVVRDDGSRPGEPKLRRDKILQALRGLAAAGSAVIVAGLDPVQAEVAGDFARQTAMPVILLLPEPAESPSKFVFTLGISPADSGRKLADRLRKNGATVIAALGGLTEQGDGDPTNELLELSCTPLPDAAQLRQAGVNAVLIREGAVCGRQVVMTAGSIGAQIGLGLGVPPALSAARGDTVMLSAGVFPVIRSGGLRTSESLPWHPADGRLPAWWTHLGLRRGDELWIDKRLQKWLDAGREPPSWWIALGHDAARLARNAVEGLAELSTEAGEVRRSHELVSRELHSAQAALWTTDATGFGGRRRLPRRIEPVSLDGPAK